MNAIDVIRKSADKNGYVPALLFINSENGNKIIDLRVHADFAIYMYLTAGTGTYVLNNTRYTYNGKVITEEYYKRLIRPDMYGNVTSHPVQHFGVIEIMVSDIRNHRL